MLTPVAADTSGKDFLLLEQFDRPSLPGGRIERPAPLLSVSRTMITASFVKRSDSSHSTELKLIAAAAMIGDSIQAEERIQHAGATGIPSALLNEREEQVLPDVCRMVARLSAAPAR